MNDVLAILRTKNRYKYMILDVRQIPLIRAAMHENMRHNVLMMGVTIAITDLRRGVVGEGGVAHRGTAKVKYARKRDAGVNGVQSRQGDCDRTELVIARNHKVGRELNFQGLHCSDIIDNDALFSIEKVLVHHVIITFAVRGGGRIQNIQPMLEVDPR